MLRDKPRARQSAAARAWEAAVAARSCSTVPLRVCPTCARCSLQWQHGRITPHSPRSIRCTRAVADRASCATQRSWRAIARVATMMRSNLVESEHVDVALDRAARAWSSPRSRSHAPSTAQNRPRPGATAQRCAYTLPTGAAAAGRVAHRFGLPRPAVHTPSSEADARGMGARGCSRSGR